MVSNVFVTSMSPPIYAFRRLSEAFGEPSHREHHLYLAPRMKLQEPLGCNAYKSVDPYCDLSSMLDPDFCKSAENHMAPGDGTARPHPIWHFTTHLRIQ